MTVQALGFPEEWWDDEGDYFCRPHPDYVAAVIADQAGSPNMWVDICRYHSNPPTMHCENVLFRSWMNNSELVSEYVDCPLLAQAVIQNFINNLEGNHD